MERKESSLKCPIIFFIHACQTIESLHPTQQKCLLKYNMIVHIQQGMEWCIQDISCQQNSPQVISNYIDVSGSWCCGTFFNTQSLSFPWCINKEYVCFSQMSVLSILQYKSSQCTYSIRTTFMSICNVLTLEGLCHTTKRRIYIR